MMYQYPRGSILFPGDTAGGGIFHVRHVGKVENFTPI